MASFACYWPAFATVRASVALSTCTPVIGAQGHGVSLIGLYRGGQCCVEHMHACDRGIWGMVL